MLDTIFFLTFWALVGIVILVFVAHLLRPRHKTSKLSAYEPNKTRRYTEYDLRLPYKRFKELYPWTAITYQDYKKLQTERAFKRSGSSENNKRMVR